MEEEQRKEITEAIKQQDTPIKPQLCALYYHLDVFYQVTEKHQPLYDEVGFRARRAQNNYHDKVMDILEGRVVAPIEQLGDLDEFFSSDERQVIKTKIITPLNVKDYWLNCLKQAPSIAALIHEWDEPVLSKLRRLTTFPTKGDERKLVFDFDENEYFSNKVLELTVDFEGDDPVHITSTTIDWYPGKNLTMMANPGLQTGKENAKGGEKKKRKQKKAQPAEVPRRTFFRIFRTQEVEDDDSSEEEKFSTDSQPFEDYDFDSVEQFTELIDFMVLKIHAAGFYGVDVSKLYEEYEAENEYETDGRRSSESSSGDDDDSDEDRDEDDHGGNKKKKGKTQKNTIADSPDKKGPTQEECKKQ